MQEITVDMNLDMTQTPLLFQCSHRARGSSNQAVDLFQQGLRNAGGDGAAMYVRKLDVKPCRACRICEKDPDSPCVLEKKDMTRFIFEAMFKAPVLYFASPIYFYHLPSRFKTLIDRSQWVYARQQKGDPEVTGLPKRPAYATFFAGREKGDKLFEGAILTLKYFLKSFNFELQEPLTFKGFDKMGDMERNPEVAEQIRSMGENAWKTHLANLG